MDDATRWKRVWELFDAVAEMPPEGREAALASLEPDALIREEVRVLLAADAAPATGPGPGPGSGSTPMLAPGAVVGHWRVDSLLGRGGMGEVYLVTRTGADFEQRAALKLMLRMQSGEDRARFAAERRILARLEHPAIAHLLDGSEYQGTPYAVIEYVDGLPLDEYARGLPLRERLQLVLQACDAVGHAHRHLVVHRDLKPGNILVTADASSNCSISASPNTCRWMRACSAMPPGSFARRPTTARPSSSTAARFPPRPTSTRSA